MAPIHVPDMAAPGPTQAELTATYAAVHKHATAAGMTVTTWLAAVAKLLK